MPLLQLLLFSYALSTSVNNISTAVLDQDNTQVSRQMVNAFERSDFFQVTQYLGSKKQIDGVFDRGQDKVVVVIKQGFAEDLKAGRKGHIAVMLDGSDPNTAQTAQGYATGLSQVFGGKVLVDYMKAEGVSTSSIGGIDIHSLTWYNPEARSQYFLIPGLIVILIMGATIQQTAIAIVK